MVGEEQVSEILAQQVKAFNEEIAPRLEELEADELRKLLRWAFYYLANATSTGEATRAYHSGMGFLECKKRGL